MNNPSSRSKSPSIQVPIETDLAETRWQLMIQHSSDLITLLSADATILYESPAALQRLLGYTPEELIGTSGFALVHPDDLPDVQQIFAQIVAHPDIPFTAEYRVRHREGHWRYFASTGNNLLHQPTVASIIVNSRDVTEQKLTESKYRNIFENSIQGIFQTTLDGRYLSANPSLAKLYGYDSPTALQQELTDIGKQLYVHPQHRQEFIEQILRDGKVTEFEAQVYHRDGSIIWISETAYAVCDSNQNILYFEGTVINITERKLRQSSLQYQAFHDILTGLPNRALFNDRLAQSLAHARRQGEMLALMFVDLDQFKTINDTLGHGVGDELLQQVAGRLSGCVREEDTVARWGGDEFTVLIPNLHRVEDGVRIAERLIQSLRPGFSIQGHELQVRCSVGVAFFPEDGEDAGTLLRNADIALYRAKAQGRDNYQLFGPDIDPAVSDSISSDLTLKPLTSKLSAPNCSTMESQLHQALEHRKLVVYYQPQVAAATGEIVRVEALVRWQHPQLGLVSPQVFIAMAEDNGLIVPIGEWVMQTACEQCRRWQSQGLPNLGIAVNLSARQFQQPDLVKSITRILHQTGLAPQFLNLEITEATAMQSFELARTPLQHLNQLGVRLSLDDFGTGYSSLGHLKRLPLKSLKIDRTFVCDLPRDSASLAIAAAIITLGRGLDLEVVGVGVETREQMLQLQELRCELLQGNLFSHPCSVEEMTALLLDRGNYAALLTGNCDSEAVHREAHREPADA